MIRARTQLFSFFSYISELGAATPNWIVCWYVYNEKMLVCWHVTRFLLGKQSNRLSLMSQHASPLSARWQWILSIETSALISSSIFFPLLLPLPLYLRSSSSILWSRQEKHGHDICRSCKSFVSSTHNDVLTRTPRSLSFSSVHPSRLGPTESRRGRLRPSPKSRSDRPRGTRLFLQPTIWR